MDDDWDAKEDITIPVKAPVQNLNKWEGEDEEEIVKDSWEDDDEDEKKDEEKVNITPVKTTKPKKEKNVGKEKSKAEEAALKEQELLEANMTPEQRAAEKLRLQKLQEEADLKTALDTLGLVSSSSTGIDAMNPITKEDFMEFSDALSKKITQFKNSDEYPSFLEELVRNLCAGLSSSNIRKIKTSLDNLFLEKQKIGKRR